MTDNVCVTRKDGEANSGIVRRFSRKSQAASVAQTVKKKVYLKRPPSKFLRKKERLQRLKKTEEYQRLYRLGKLPGSKR